MRTIAGATSGMTVLVVRTPVGPVTSGGPWTRTARADGWELLIDDFGHGPTNAQRMQRILAESARRPVDAIFRHFDSASTELFALVGPPGAIAGSGPALPGRGRIAVSFEPADGVLAMGFVSDQDTERPGWLLLPAGTAVCWGPKGPEVLCDLRLGTIDFWLADEHTGGWLPVDEPSSAA